MLKLIATLKRAFTLLLSAVFVLLAIAPPAFAQELLPHAFTGNLEKVTVDLSKLK